MARFLAASTTDPLSSRYKSGRLMHMAFGAVIIVLLTSGSSWRHEGPGSSVASPLAARAGDASTLDTGTARRAKVSHMSDSQELLERVRETGSISVIVTLDIPYTPEPALPTQAEIEAQRTAISAAQDELMASLAGYNATETTRMTIFPQIVLTVDEPALRRLLCSPLGADVQENKLSPPAD